MKPLVPFVPIFSLCFRLRRLMFHWNGTHFQSPHGFCSNRISSLFGIKLESRNMLVRKITPRSLKEKKATRTLEGKGVNRTPSPSTFDITHPIDMIFGTYNKMPLYFQLSKTTSSLIGFHGNQSYINDVILGFKVFGFYLNLNYSTSKWQKNTI